MEKNKRKNPLDEIDVVKLDHNENMMEAYEIYWSAPLSNDDDERYNEHGEEINVDELADKIIATGDTAYMYAFARDVAGAPVEKLVNAIKSLTKTNNHKSRPNYDDLPGM